MPVASVLATAGRNNTATRAAPGINSRRSSRRFEVNSAFKKLIPVKLPSGRARLATSNSREIDTAFEAIARERPDALLVTPDPFFRSRRMQLTHLATRHAIPAAYALRDYAEAGGPISYGASLMDAYRQTGTYAGRILKGAKTADLPVVQSSKFELIINAQTARILGLTVPPALLARADEVIE